MNNFDLINKASEVVNTVQTKAGMMGDVGCALIAKNGKVYSGVCAAVGSSNFCAEGAAIGAMITDKEFGIKKIVAVWKDDKGQVYVIPPCGRCRQMMRDVNEENLNNTEVILNKEKTEKLKDLIPFFDLWQKID
jgi:cytidine deaminase